MWLELAWGTTLNALRVGMSGPGLSWHGKGKHVPEAFVSTQFAVISYTVAGVFWSLPLSY